MSTLIPLLSVIGAFVAAALSLATFVVTNRRNDVRWLKESTLEAVVDFADGSFQRYSRSTFEARQRRDDLGQHHTRADTGRRQQNRALTRLRLLAPEEVVVAAEGVLREDNEIERFFRSRIPAEERLMWEEINEPRQSARTLFFGAYRHQFGLGPARTIRNDLSGRRWPSSGQG